jgi:Glycosyltransferase family 87
MSSDLDAGGIHRSMSSKTKLWAADAAVRYRSFLITILAYLLIVNIGACVLYVPIALLGRSDFRHLYTAGYMVRSGYSHQLYDSDVEFALQNKLAGPLSMTLPFNHLAYETLFFAPLSLLAFRAAYLVFFGVNLAMLVGCFALMRPYLSNLRTIWAWLPLSLFLCFYPAAITLIQGQDSILMLTLFVAAFVAHQKGHDLWAGIFVGLTLFKFQFGIPVFLLCLAWKWWRFVLGYLVASVAVSGISVWITGASGTAAYLRSLVSMSVGLRTAQQQDFYGIHPVGMPNLRGLVSVLAGPHISHFWVQAITILCSAVLLLLAVRSRPSFSLAILVSILVSYHSLIHDAVLVLIPVGLLGASSILDRLPYSQWILTTALVIVVLPTLLTQTPGPPWIVVFPIFGLTILYLAGATSKGYSGMPMDSGEYVTKSL